MEKLRRLVVTEAKSTPTLRPVRVFMDHLFQMDKKELKSLDAELVNFVTFRGAENQQEIFFKNDNSNNNLSRNINTTKYNKKEENRRFISASMSESHILIRNWPPSSLKNNRNNNNNNNNNGNEEEQQHKIKKRNLVFCDSSILLQRQLSSLAASASNPSSPVISYVFPFSAILLSRFQVAQSDAVAVSSAFRVGVYSQLRQLNYLFPPPPTPSSSLNENNNNIIIPPVSVLPPSIEVELLRPSATTTTDRNKPSQNDIDFARKIHWNPSENLISQQCLHNKGESNFFCYTLPRLIFSAQRDIHLSSSSSSASCFVTAASTHRNVQAECLKLGIRCDSLSSITSSSSSASTNNKNTNASTTMMFSNSNDGNSNSASSNNDHHRKAADLCRSVLTRLKTSSSK